MFESLTRKKARLGQILLLVLILTGCDSDDETEAESSPPDIGFTVSAHPENSLMALASITVSESASVSIEFSSDRTTSRTTSWTTSDTEHAITLIGMRAETTYTINGQVKLASGETFSTDPVTFTTGSLPSNAPEVTLTQTSDANLAGITFFGAGIGTRNDSTEPLYFGVDEDGEYVWYLHGTDITNADPLIRDLGDGELLVVGQNEILIVNYAGEQLQSYSLAGMSFHHDVRLLPNGNLILLSNESQMINDQSLLVDSIVEIDPTGAEVWRWSTADYFDTGRFPSDLATTDKDGSLDWTHANALYYLPDEDAILLSSRSQSWITKIDHQTGDIIWIMGSDEDTADGFSEQFLTLTSGTYTSGQHAPMITESGDLLAYDNRNDTGGETDNSRAVRFSLNEEDFSATQEWEAIMPKYTFSLGDVDVLDNGNILACAGGTDKVGPGANTTAYIVELSSDDSAEVVWEIMVEAVIFRAERIGWDSLL